MFEGSLTTKLDDIPGASTVMAGLLTAMVKRLGGRIKITTGELAALVDQEIIIGCDEQQTFHMQVRPMNNGNSKTESGNEPGT